MTRRTASVLAATTLALVAAPAAHAATATIDGSPLNITASDIGSIQISFDGSRAASSRHSPRSPRTRASPLRCGARRPAR